MWTESDADAALQSRGYIVSIGQIGPALRRKLSARAKRGELIQSRGHWNAPFGGPGIGPLKTVWRLP